MTIRTGELTERVLAHFGCTGETYRPMQQKYVAMTQLRADSGWDVTTADVVVVGAWGSTNHYIQGFEVKISRSDWLNEVKKPTKNDSIKQYCDMFWLVIADESMVKEGELPEDWGMMVPSNKGLKVVKQAPLLSPKPVTHGFVAMMMRSNQSDVVPADVHIDRMKDIQRKYEADYKEKSEKLLSLVKDLDKVLGIKIDWENYNKKWKISVDNWELMRTAAGGPVSELTPEQLAAAIRTSLSGDIRSMRYNMQSINRSAQELVKVTKDFIGEL